MTLHRLIQFLAFCGALGVLTPAFAFERGTCVELKGETLDGDELERTEGTWTIVEFWATWCQPCHTSLDKLQELVSSSTSTSLRLVGINSESDFDRVRKFKNQREWTFQTLIDPDLRWLKMANPRAMPLTVLLNPDGCVVWRGVGGDERTHTELKNALSQSR